MNWYCFSSQKEADAYLRCLRKLQIGDKVCVFLQNGDVSDHRTKTISDTIEIVGIDGHARIIGSKNRLFPSMYKKCLSSRVTKLSLNYRDDDFYVFYIYPSDAIVAKFYIQKLSDRQL